MSAYLQELTIRLATAMGNVPEELRQRHAHWVWSKQNGDGGWAGREGTSDPYYTSFALRTLAVTGELYGDRAESAANFLRSRLNEQETIVDLAALIYGASLLENAAGVDVFETAGAPWKDTVSDFFETLRRDDGGYAKSPASSVGSTYNSFLVLLCRELIERPLNNPNPLIQFIFDQENDTGGGFREVSQQKRAGTNPTAAAIGILKILNALDDELQEDTVQFLGEMQTDEGGLRANTRIPIADLLSSFTGFLTLIDLGGGRKIDRTQLLRYANRLQQPAGGFHGAEWDKVCDVEYTFYGIGCLALIHADLEK
ncbi:MAG: beta-hydroxylase [Planctomycetaceae bacterium]|nr:beta-hydroxylase [Planctomycetaceae bacterium]|tara:strand:+ start:533 stop:1471 length:939 start_codon:yes stop_codon:yes gene_type:complete